MSIPEDVSKLELQRRERLSQIQALGFDPYGGRYDHAEHATAIKGRFNRIIPTGDFKARTFPLRLDLPTEARLLPGFDLEVLLPTGKPKNVLLAPRAAIVRQGEKTTVVAIIDNQAEIIPVTISGYDGSDAVISGSQLKDENQLKSGMTVVIRGNERLRPGQTVIIIPAVGEQKE